MHCQDNIGYIILFPAPKPQIQIATMYAILIIYSSKQDTLESVET